MHQNVLVEFHNISKHFPGVRALSDVSFSIKKGEIHALCGENGAGKSTLINICSGVFGPTHGNLVFKGEEVKFNTPKDAKSCNISTVHQEVPLCDNMTVAENIFLGPHPKAKFGFVDRKFMREETSKLLDFFHLKYNPATLVQNLSLSEKSIIQLLRAIYSNPDLLILDEPTASLLVAQKDQLFSILRNKRREKEMTVLYISHKLEEIFEIADRISVLRDGEYIRTVQASETDVDSIINMMVGRDIKKYIYDKKECNGEIVFEVKGLSRKGLLKDINFTVKKGEILGFAGLQGAGRTELARTIIGIDKPDNGEFHLNGTPTKIKNINHAIKTGIAMIPEDRRKEGIVPSMTVDANLIMVALKKVSKLSFILKKKKDTLLRYYLDKLKIKINSPRQLVDQLSGGNQQKIIISRWIANDPKILICDEPTRGIDVNAKSEIHSILVDMAKNGLAIIFISSELPDLLTICDRIIVMRDGMITGELMRLEATEEKIMHLATTQNNSYHPFIEGEHNP